MKNQQKFLKIFLWNLASLGIFGLWYSILIKFGHDQNPAPPLSVFELKLSVLEMGVMLVLYLFFVAVLLAGIYAGGKAISIWEKEKENKRNLFLFDCGIYVLCVIILLGIWNALGFIMPFIITFMIVLSIIFGGIVRFFIFFSER